MGAKANVFEQILRPFPRIMLYDDLKLFYFKIGVYLVSMQASQNLQSLPEFHHIQWGTSQKAKISEIRSSRKIYPKILKLPRIDGDKDKAATMTTRQISIKFSQPLKNLPTAIT